MATYNVMNEGPVDESTNAGSATITTEPAPAADSAPAFNPAPTTYAAPAYGGDAYGQPQQQYSSLGGGFDSSPIGGILPKLGLIGAAVVMVGILIEYSGICALVHQTGSLVSLSAIETLFLLVPVVFALLGTFRADKIPHRDIFNFLVFINAVAAAVWSFFVFIVYAQTSSDTDVAALGAAAAGCFFNFLGEGVMAFAFFISM